MENTHIAENCSTRHGPLY